MKSVFGEVFDRLRKDIQKNLSADAENALLEPPASLRAATSGQTTFDFVTDGVGNYSQSESKYGGGVTLTCSASLSAPNAPYTLTIGASDGGGGKWTRVQVNQELKFKIKTSLWHKTKITITYSSGAKNAVGKGIIHYSY